MNLRELTYRIYGEDRLSAKLDVINHSSQRANAALSKTSAIFSGLKKQTSSAAAELPFLTRGLSLIQNPAVLATGAVFGLGKVMNDATNVAASFNSEFRELYNLNLDKPISEINKLRNEVVNLAAEKGFDARLTSRGFYDLQSITGKTGNEARQIVGRQGQFADVMNADFTEWIAGTSKAMANYGFGADELEKYNRSAYATVQAAKIDYNELSRVQAVYAGAAASAKQSYDSANKLLSVFTIKTQSANEAATLTKSAFQDLFKDNTIKAFVNSGVDMYDELTGNHRQVDEIMKDLNKRFMGAKNDREIDELRNKFSGSEGLTALIQAATDQSGNLLNTLHKFDNVDFNFGKSLKAAYEDVMFVQDKTQKMLKTTQIQFGQEWLPYKLAFQKDLLQALQWVSELKKEVSNSGVSGIFSAKRNLLIRDEENLTQSKTDSIKSIYEGKLARAHLLPTNEFEENQAQLVKMYRDARLNMQRFSDYHNRDSISNYAKSHDNMPRMLAEIKLEYEHKRWQSIASTYEELIKQFPEYQENPLLNPLTASNTEKGVNNEKLQSEDPKITKGLSEISGGGQQVKSVTVDFKNLVENFTVSTTNLTEAGPDIEKKITEFIIRAVGGAEQILSGS